MSALAIHHLDGSAKAALFARVAAVLTTGGRFVSGDVVVPRDPSNVVTPIDGDHDTPDSVADQLTWLEDGGLRASVAWAHRDLAVIVGRSPLEAAFAGDRLVGDPPGPRRRERRGADGLPVLSIGRPVSNAEVHDSIEQDRSDR